MTSKASNKDKGQEPVDTSNLPIYEGRVVWFNSYGFIAWEKDGVKQEDMFVHYSDLQCQGFKTINKGVKVSFKVGANRDGDPKAIEVIQIPG